MWYKHFPNFWMRNFLGIGIPFFAIGMLIKKYSDCILQTRSLQYLTKWGVLSTIISFFEYRWLDYNGYVAVKELYIGSAISAVIMVLFALTVNQREANILSKLGEKYSLYIYTLHPVIMTIIHYAILPLLYLCNVLYSFTSPIFIVMLTVLLVWGLRAVRLIR